MPSDCVPCPFCSKAIFRNKFGEHLLSRQHRSQLKENLLKKPFLLQGKVLPQIETESGKMACVCFGCRKGYHDKHLETRQHKCKSSEQALPLFKAFLGIEDTTQIVSSDNSALEAKVQELQKKVERLSKDLQEAEKAYEERDADVDAQEPYVTAINILKDHPLFENKSILDIQDTFRQWVENPTTLHYPTEPQNEIVESDPKVVKKIPKRAAR